MFQSFEDNRVHTGIAALHAQFPEVGRHSNLDRAQVLAQQPGRA
ncbi:hypothetical protein AB0G15_07940 [Streptosporangium sp. NPDC023825]